MEIGSLRQHRFNEQGFGPQPIPLSDSRSPSTSFHKYHFLYCLPNEKFHLGASPTRAWALHIWFDIYDKYNRSLSIFSGPNQCMIRVFFKLVVWPSRVNISVCAQPNSSFSGRVQEQQLLIFLGFYHLECQHVTTRHNQPHADDMYRRIGLQALCGGKSWQCGWRS